MGWGDGMGAGQIIGARAASPRVGGIGAGRQAVRAPGRFAAVKGAWSDWLFLLRHAQIN